MNLFHGPGGPKEDLPAFIGIFLILSFLIGVAGKILLAEDGQTPAPATPRIVQDSNRVG